MTPEQIKFAKERLMLLDQLQDLKLKKYDIDTKIANLEFDLHQLETWPANYFYSQELHRKIMAIIYPELLPVKL